MYDWTKFYLQDRLIGERFSKEQDEKRYKDVCLLKSLWYANKCEVTKMEQMYCLNENVVT